MFKMHIFTNFRSKHFSSRNDEVLQ